MKKLFLLLLGKVSLCCACASDSLPLRKWTPEQVRADISFMVKTMEEVHPNLFHNISREAFYRKHDSLLLTLRDSVTTAEAWRKFAVLTGAINEGHTFLSPPGDLRREETPMFPLYLKAFDGQAFYVQLDASEEQALRPGDRILSINGVTAKALVEQFSPFLGGLPPFKELIVSLQLPTLLLLYEFRGPYLVRYLRHGEERAVSLQPQPRKLLNERMAAFKKAGSVLPYEYTVLDEGTGYLNFRSMVDVPRFSTFVDSVFTAIHSTGTGRLIIDLRGNGGGNSSLGDKLLDYLTGKRYRMTAATKWKISQPYKDLYNSLPENQRYLKGSPLEKRYLEGKNATFITQEHREKKPGKPRHRFRGKVCFLIGPNTYSSANMLANAVKDYDIATIIGEPTGECPNDFGEVITVKLPHTGIQFGTSTKQYVRANGRDWDPDPILPHIIARDDPRTVEDEGLDFARKWILQ